MMKLSKEQSRVLGLMQFNRLYTAYELGCSIRTLRALQDKGLVKSKGWGEPGAFSMQRTHIQWMRIKGK